MNRKAEKVARILNMSVNDVINELDRGMWDILIELNISLTIFVKIPKNKRFCKN